MISCAFDEDIKKWDCVILFEFNGEFDIYMTGIEIV